MLAEIVENRKYTRGGPGSAISATSSLTSAASSASKVFRYLADATTIVQNINSQLFSVGQDFQVQEIRRQLELVCEAGVKVSVRADEYGVHALNDLLKELETLQDCVNKLSQDKVEQLKYNLHRVAQLISCISEVVSAKSSTSVEGSTYSQRETASDSERRIARLEAALEALVSKQSASSEEVEEITNDQRAIPPAINPGTRGNGATPSNATSSAMYQASSSDAANPQAIVALPGRQMYIMPTNGWSHHNSRLLSDPSAQGLAGIRQPTLLGDARRPAFEGPPVLIHNALQGAANADARARQDNKQRSLLRTVSCVKAKLQRTLSRAWVAAALAILLHDHIPGLNSARSSKRDAEELRATRAALHRTKLIGQNALEDCHDVVVAWREHARRPRFPFQTQPEPDSSKCDIRKVLRSVEMAAAMDDSAHPGLPA